MPIVHLFRTAEVHDVVAESIFEYLEQFPGPIQWKFWDVPSAFEKEGSIHDTIELKDPSYQTQKPPQASFSSGEFSNDSKKIKFEHLEEFLEPVKIRTYGWEHFFELIDQFRLENSIPATDLVFLLTYKGNHLNWFVGGNYLKPNNFFIHLLHWEYFTMSEPTFPVAYQLATFTLKSLMFPNFKAIVQSSHERSIGCMMDFCKDKKEIGLKMRTADVCDSCWLEIQSKSIPQPLLQQVFKIMESVRSNMLFRDRFNKLRVIPKLQIIPETGKLVFAELNDLEISLNPLEMAIYQFFLSKPEGVLLNSLMDYEDELFEFYVNATHEKNLTLLKTRIADLVHPLSNSASEKISRIKKKLIQFLGSELAEHFIIQGPNGHPKRIRFQLHP